MDDIAHEPGWVILTIRISGGAQDLRHERIAQDEHEPAHCGKPKEAESVTSGSVSHDVEEGEI
ncbi:MAG: hypothetical protein RhofKO_12070 [Rhodothermales bacterium]